MRYFTYIAEQAFKTAPSGERLFYTGGPWSRPYLIPDNATEQRLYVKQIWRHRISIGGLMLVQPLLIRFFPQIIIKPYWVLAYFTGIIFAFWVVGQIMFAHDLRGLKRMETRLQLHSFFGQTAQRHSPGALFLGVLGSLLFVLGGVFMLSTGMYVIGIISVVFFGLCAVAWGYALCLKLNSHKLPKPPDIG